MNILLKTLIALITLFSLSSCDELTRIEPDSWQRNEFESQVRRSVRRAVMTPGIDNGSTLIVSTDGDTLIAPADSITRATPSKIIYVEIQSPRYPGAISSRGLAMTTTIVVIGIIFLLLLVILSGVFITVWRRQSGRNNTIKSAITDSYHLPESFYTGIPSAPPVNITQYVVSDTPSPKDAEKTGDNQTPPIPNQTTLNQSEPLVADSINSGIKNVLSGLGAPVGGHRTKQLYTSFSLIGIGVMLFLAFACSGNEGMGFFVGGSLFVLGISKFLSIHLSKRF